MLVDVEIGKPLFAVVSAYHSDASNWEIEDYHSATILACKTWSPLSVPWIVDEVAECFDSNKTHLKSLFKSFMIDLLGAVNTQDTKK